MLNNPLQMHLRLLKKKIQKATEATDDLIGNKNADKIEEVSKT